MRNIEERNKIVVENLGLINYIVSKKFYRIIGHGMTYNELVSAGYEGLIKAAESWDENKDCAFSSYACPAIFNSIKRGVISNRLINVPEYRNVDILKVEAAILNNPDATSEQIAEDLELSASEVSDLINASNLRKVCFYEQNKEESPVYEVEDKAESIENIVCQKDTTEQLLNVIQDVFGEKCRKVAEEYYCNSKTLRRIAKEMHLSSERVREYKDKIILSEMNDENRLYFKHRLREAQLA